MFLLLIFKPLPLPFHYVFVLERVVLRRLRFVVSEWRKGMRKEFTPLLCLPHVINDLWHKFLILLFRILRVEDAVLRMPETNASETVSAIVHAQIAVVQIISAVAVYVERRMMRVWGNTRNFHRRVLP